MHVLRIAPCERLQVRLSGLERLLLLERHAAGLMGAIVVFTQNV